MNEKVNVEETNVPVEETSAENRAKDFLERYRKLVEETKIDFATYPVFVPDGQGGFKVIVQNTPVDISKIPPKDELITEKK